AGDRQVGHPQVGRQHPADPHQPAPSGANHWPLPGQQPVEEDEADEDHRPPAPGRHGGGDAGAGDDGPHAGAGRRTPVAPAGWGSSGGVGAHGGNSLPARAGPAGAASQRARRRPRPVPQARKAVMAAWLATFTAGAGTNPPEGSSMAIFTTMRNRAEPGGWQANSVAVYATVWSAMSRASGSTISIPVTA